MAEIYLQLQTRSPENYTLTFRTPDGCDIADCDFFAGVDTNEGNSDYLDIYMEGDAGAWLAIGFSDSPDMVGIQHSV